MKIVSDEDNGEISKSVNNNCNKSNKYVHREILIVRKLLCQLNIFVIYKFSLLLPSTQTLVKGYFRSLNVYK